MAEKIISPGVFTNEIDQSFLPAGVQAIGAAIVGPTAKGPAGIPIQVSTYSEFVQHFGDTIEREQVATVCGYVLAVGPDAYKDANRYERPWCKEGDWIIFGRYAGSRFRIEGGEVRLLNDDEVLATITNPDDILHY